MRLSVRTQQTVLNGAAAACLLAVPAVLVWGLMVPARLISDVATASSPETSHTSNVSSTLRPNVPSPQDDALWTKRLRRPLFDPPPPVVQKKELPPLRVALLGTIIEPGNSMAIVAGPDGNMEYKRLGDRVGPP